MAALICMSAAGWSQTQDAAGTADPLDKYNVVWDSPSKDHTGSMPIGNGDIGMNVWMEPNGDLLLLLSKTDAWSEDGELLKLGRVRVSFSPNPVEGGAPFEQALHLRQGEIFIRAGAPGKEVAVRVWVDANRPVIRVEADSPSPFDMKAVLELWRTGQRQGNPPPICPYADTILENRADRIVWQHRNEKSVWSENLKFQGLGDFIARSADPLLHRTFGGCIEGEGLVGENSTTLGSHAPRKRFAVSIHVLCDQTDTADAWEKGLERLVAEDNAVALDAAREAHRRWWNEFWNRSWIRITGSEQAETISRAYALQRWINACGGRGKAAIKFNGSIFTVGQDDIRNKRIGADDPDYRRWGGRYWWQNTRLPYWPMLACGDYDLMLSLFDMYKAMIPLEEHRTKVWFDHHGAFINETIYFWGMLRDYDYGVAYGERLEKGLPFGDLIGRGANYIRLEYTASPELMAMMLDYYDHARDENFLRETLLPTCDALLEFWDEHYKSDENGRLVLYPAQALETYWDAEDPAPDVAGLKWVLGRLLDLPETATGAARREFWEKLSAKVPPLPMEEKDGKKILAAAKEIHGEAKNSENPELYAVFPFRLYGAGKPDLEMARHTFEMRRHKGHWGWVQCDVQAAHLGLTQTAANGGAYRAGTKDEASRFPAFWGPNADWIPDQCHGGNMMMGLQAMLMQADGGRILLLPAWPKDWDVDFKLHAPGRTVVQGTVKDGKIVSVTTDPASRAKDIAALENGAVKGDLMFRPETAHRASVRPPLKVLIIGNSQIGYNDLPGMIKTISESAPEASPRIEPDKAFVNGKGLRGYWDAGEGPGSPRAMIAAQKWDYVVIQEIFAAKEREFEEYATKFDNEIRKAGSRTILFATASVSESYGEGYKYPDSFRKLNDMQIAFGLKRDIPVAAAGYAWMKYWGPNPSEAQRLDLYAKDKGHPGVKGSYIYACLLYAHITGHSPELLTLPDKDLDYGNGNVITRQELVGMRKAAWEQYQESTGGKSAQ